MRTLRLLCLGLVASGCQTSHLAAWQGTDAAADLGEVSATDGGGGPIDAGGGPIDAGAPWVPLIGRSWTVVRGATNTYRCRTVPIASDLYIVGFRATEPLGQFREFLLVADSTSYMGDYDCSAGMLATGRRMIHASGLGSGPTLFPSGIAVHVKANQYLTLVLHLSNPTDAPLTDTSNVEIQLGAPVASDHESELLLAGKVGFTIPAMELPFNVIGGCTSPRDFTLLSLSPFMNAIAVHQQLILTHAASPRTLFYQDYDFHHQIAYPMTVDVKTGDQIQVGCTYINSTGHLVGFGDGSDHEWCFNGIYRYPATSSGPFECVM